MKIIGITGSVACGKSTVLNMLAQKKYAVYNCDDISRMIFEKKQDEICKELGDEILENGKVSRYKVKKIIFRDDCARKKIEKIIHPDIYRYLLWELFICFLTNRSVVFIEIQLFYELNLQKYIDSVLVYCDERTQKERIAKRDGSELVNDSLKVQFPIEEKKKMATWVIDNTKSIEETKKVIDEMVFGGTGIVTYIFLIFILFLLFKI
ncbi:dephospho-CoA kinase [Edhazardia aedis USNM 41457]|uniref:Dephospho-CoA kinase n=1 Tax=Edhazardia aedis (strain USNM 41457) TaxID=1003232 RepID=J9DKE6_EDHAE|nr:dephospho-CoA kinase [Edhazardia aedis USNM 41457]|eukprot:EJW03050.1 dephospho-CoA kinase [Edhazardia aedis USNM 41457]